MSLDAHIDELAEKHRELDRRIEKEEAHPGSSTFTILECFSHPVIKQTVTGSQYGSGNNQ